MKKLLPTCQQPSSKQMAAAKAFQQRQQAIYNPNVQKAEQQMRAPTQPAAPAQPQKPKSPEEREMNRCVTSGRLPASCSGNSLLGWFSQTINSVAPGVAHDGPASGPVMAGAFQGVGNWRLDFVDGGVLVNCSFLSPNHESYSLKFEPNRTANFDIVDSSHRALIRHPQTSGSISALRG